MSALASILDLCCHVCLGGKQSTSAHTIIHLYFREDNSCSVQCCASPVVPHPEFRRPKLRKVDDWNGKEQEKSVLHTTTAPLPAVT